MTYLENDLARVASLGDDIPLPAASSLSSQRARLTEAITAEAVVGAPARGAVRSGGAVPAGFAVTRRSRKRPWFIAGVSVAAASVAAGAVLVSGVARGGASHPAAHSPAPIPGVPNAAHLTAVNVLDRAAAAAEAGPDTQPRPDQFVYLKTYSKATGTTETWRSIDGSRNGFVLQNGQKTMLWGCQNGWQKIQPDPGSGIKWLTERCVAQPAYMPGMPTQASKMKAFLASYFSRQTSQPANLDNPAVMQKLVESLFDQYYLSPRQEAALYQYFATLPGLTVIPHATDDAGRSVIEVSATFPANQWGPKTTVTWIFDAKTYAYLGFGEPAYQSAVLNYTLVDQAGQRP
jgi:hypothetical protein